MRKKSCRLLPPYFISLPLLSLPPGLHSVLVALLSEKADIQYSPDFLSPDMIVKEIQGLGFGAELISESEQYQQGQLDLSVGSMAVHVPLYLCVWPPLVHMYTQGLV